MTYTESCQTHKIESSLCGCCSDCGMCCFTLCCFPCAESKAWAASRGEKCSCCHCFIVPSGFWTRQNIRTARGMAPSYCCDLITISCCTFCFENQNIREIKAIQEQSQISPISSDTNINQFAKQGPI